MATDTIRNTEEKMRKAAEGLRKELGTIRTGHASPALVEHIKADYNGVPTPIKQMASISAPEARLLLIQPWDKSSIRSIEKAILTSELGLNPSSDGNVIRIAIPPLSEERRQELIKIVRKRVEERRVAIRNIRHETMLELKDMEKDKQISQDEHKRLLSQLQKLTDSFIGVADKIGQEKEAELMQV